ncbi:MAG TPA: hypothetical protein VFP65_16105 [Anaeromyxobacteraceae bacterium]|nr:hypothetical protein [Anaeromyxobacteraceae bacterium]
MTVDDVKWREDDAARSRRHRYDIHAVRASPDRLVSNDIVRAHVPEAHLTGEVRCTRPVRMERVGTLDGDFGPDGLYDCWVVADERLLRDCARGHGVLRMSMRIAW